MDIKIDDGVPLPTMGKKYPIRDLRPGQSFFAVINIRRMSALVNSVRVSADDGRKYTCRSVEEGGVKGVRVWRLS